MKLWRFPNPWDYHQQGAYVVAAETREEAIAVLEAEAERGAFISLPSDYRDTVEEVGLVYTDDGCDC